MNRRHFLGRLLGFSIALPSAVGVLSACDGGSNGSGGSGEEPDGDCSTGAPVKYLNPGHTHSELTLSAEDIVAAIPGDYLLLGRGGNNHSHTFALTAADFVTLQSGFPLTLDNDNPNHGHIIELSC